MADPNDAPGNIPFTFTDSFYESSSDDEFLDDTSFTSPTVQITERISKFNTMLKIGLSNVQSLVSHFSELSAFISAGNFDIVALTETWLKPSINDHLINIPGYYLIRNDRNHKGSGGVATYVKNSLKATVLFSPVSDDFNSEQLWLNIKLKNRSLILAVVYRPPSVPVSSLEYIDSNLFDLASDVDDVIVLGDFNVNLLKPAIPGGRKIRELCDIHDLEQLVDRPTYICNNAESILDLVMVRQRHKVKYIDQVIQPGISHHNFIFLVYDEFVPKHTANYVTTRNWKRLDLNAFNEDAVKAPWHLIYNEANINNMVATFNNVINHLLDVHVPLVTFKAKKSPSPWLNDDIISIMKKRDRAKSIFNQTKLTMHWEKYKILRNKVKKAVRNAKVKTFDDCINNEKSTRMFWSHLKKLQIHGSSNGSNVTDVHPDEINQHFINNQSSVSFDAERLNKQISHFLSIKPNNNFGLATVTQKEIFDIISGISTNALGSDGINKKVIKLFLPFILPVITHIVNYSITSSTFPDAWKLAIIKPILKNGRSTNVTNLRPISILPCLSKILERVVANQFKMYLYDCDLLNPHQSGFRNMHSTTSALIKISNDILKAIDDSKFTSLVLLDFAKAFDTVNHSLLLAKLHAIGVDELSVNWFRCYLTGRKQCVRTGDNTSSYLDVISGVPQGSILGPLLFSIFINDLPECVKTCNPHLFADDVQTTKTFSPINASVALSELNDDLDNINKWSCDNGLSLNVDKCQHIIIGSQQLFRNHPISEISHYNSVSINNYNLKTYQQVKNLGVIFDQHLSWDAHLNSQCRIALQRLRYLSKFKNFLSKNTKRKLTSSLILPLLDYCDSVYYNAAKTLLNKVQKVQNACVRFVLNIRKHESVRVHFNSIKWIAMEKRRTLHSLLLIYKIFKFKEPSYLFDVFNSSLTNHSYPTRFNCNLSFTPPRSRTTKYSNSFIVQSMKCWNDLPEAIKSAPTVQSFKSRVYQHLLNS